MSGKQLYAVYLPLHDNGGRPFPASVLQAVRDTISSFVGGCTVLPHGEGYWIGPDGLVYRDAIVMIQAVALDDAPTSQFFVQLITRLARILDQQEIFTIAMPVVVVPPVAIEGPR